MGKKYGLVFRALGRFLVLFLLDIFARPRLPGQYNGYSVFGVPMVLSRYMSVYV